MPDGGGWEYKKFAAFTGGVEDKVIHPIRQRLPTGGGLAPSYREGPPPPSFSMFVVCMRKIWLSRSVRLQPNRRERCRRQAANDARYKNMFPFDDSV